MCGRYRFERTAPVPQERFDRAYDIPERSARATVTPTQIVPVVVHHRPNSVALMRRRLILWLRQGRRRNGSIHTVGEKRMHGTINPASDHRCTPVDRTILLLDK